MNSISIPLRLLLASLIVSLSSLVINASCQDGNPGDSLEVLVIGPQPVSTLVMDEEYLSVSPEILVSRGFMDEDFDYSILIEAGGNNMLNIQTDANRPLQYTLSDLDGRIRQKHRFSNEHMLDITDLPNGHYALYFFQGTDVVRAVLLNKQAKNSQSM